MRMRMLSAEETRRAYHEDLERAFPPRELKPLSSIEGQARLGRYQVWGAEEDGAVLGTAFFWLGDPGQALLDYLCVSEDRRGRGIGSEMLRRMRALGGWTAVLGEAEAPEAAPDPDLARRRLAFYARNGARLAGYDTELFGVWYRTLYWSDGEMEDAEVLRAHRTIYRLEEIPERYRDALRIPREEGTA